MKKITLLWFCVCGFMTGAQSLHKKINVLFIGNSYTYVNNLPQLITDIALANGDTMVYDSNCPGGYTFANHFNDAVTLAKINATAWKYVVLQAQSQEPSFSPGQVAAQTLPYALKLDSAIGSNNPCGTTVFYETWGRKNGDASNCPFYPPVCTYLGMQNRLKESYKLFSDTCHGVMAPAGEAFRRSISFSPGIDLYSSDQSHPSLEGSYLTAAVFYEVLFKRSVLSNTYNPGIGSGTLTFLQQVAHSTLQDSLAVWNLGKNLPWAAFTHSMLSGAVAQFQALVTNTNNKWYFGDGGTGTGASLTHTYVNSGTYTVSHVAFDSCKKDSLVSIITVTISPGNGLYEMKGANRPLIYPNPCHNVINILTDGANASGHYVVRIYNSLGEVVLETAYTDNIDVTMLPPGIFYAQVKGLSEHGMRFIKAGP